MKPWLAMSPLEQLWSRHVNLYLGCVYNSFMRRIVRPRASALMPAPACVPPCTTRHLRTVMRKARAASLTPSPVAEARV